MATTAQPRLRSALGGPSPRPSRGALPDGPPQHPWVLLYNWITRPLETFDACARRYGDPFTYRLPGMPPLVTFSNPEAVKEVFAASGDAMHAGEANWPLAPFVGKHSVLVLDGKEHIRQRKLLLPPFQGERMAAYGQAMIDLTHDAIDAWPVGEVFPIQRSMQSVTLRVIVRTVFGIDDGPLFEEFVTSLTDMLDVASWPLLFLQPFQKDFGRISPWGRFLRKAGVVHAMLREQIHARRRAGTSGRADVLSLLVDAKDEQGQPMTDEEIRDELITLLTAGHETTATSLAWAFRWLLDTPHARARLTEEIAGAARRGPLTPERLNKLEYLDAVVRETMRLSPVVPLVARVLKEPTTVGGVALPPGVAVACSIYLAQRRPEVYPNAARFDPDRFVGTKFTPNEFFPFGGGVRRCIGMAFAYYEMKMVLGTIVSRASLDLAPGPRPAVGRRGIILAPTGGTNVVLYRREARRRLD